MVLEKPLSWMEIVLCKETSKILSVFKENGITRLRLPLWVDPIAIHAGCTAVKKFSQTLRSKGFKTTLSLHYSSYGYNL